MASRRGAVGWAAHAIVMVIGAIDHKARPALRRFVIFVSADVYGAEDDAGMAGAALVGGDAIGNQAVVAPVHCRAAGIHEGDGVSGAAVVLEHHGVVAVTGFQTCRCRRAADDVVGAGRIQRAVHISAVPGADRVLQRDGASAHENALGIATQSAVGGRRGGRRW